MPVFDLFSKRQRRLRGDVPDVYQYDDIPYALRVQIVHIIRDAIGADVYPTHAATEAYVFLHDTLAREYGLFRLSNERVAKEAFFAFLLQVPEQEKAIDAIEIAFRYADLVTRNRSRYGGNPAVSADDAIQELNARFREHGVGYQFEAGEILRVDSQLVHSEVVKPVLSLLAEPKYKGPNQEFLNAHEHYRNGRHEEAITECLKSFESTLKVICNERGWSYDEGDTAKRLIEIVFSKGLIPSYLQSEFSALRSSLESGVPTVRNKQGGHGQGATVRNVPAFLASYLLHLTAVTILLLGNAEAALP